MEEVEIITRKTIKPNMRVIMTFLADDKYMENAQDSEGHRSHALIWHGDVERITATLNEVHDVDKVIEEEIAAFLSMYVKVLIEMNEQYDEVNVLIMQNSVYQFIKESIRSIAD